jgi:hypothetical protein
MTMGDNQRGVVGQPLATPLEALVVDRNGNPLAGVEVTFSVVLGGGNLDGQPTAIRLTGTDGLARAVVTLSPEPGINNNVVHSTFEGLAGLPATFTASGLVPGDPADTSFTGVVLDNGHTPIPGATISIPGTPLSTTTDAQGQFTLANVPVGHIHLRINPSTSPRPETFPPLEFETVTVAGQRNILGQPILIPAINPNCTVVGGPQDVTVAMLGVPGLNLTVFANSVTARDGSSTACITISQVHLDKVPMAPPSGTIFMPPAWTIQPAGTHFNPPARITIPNDGMPAGRMIDIFQFDHDLNQFINVGKGTTTEDGLLIVSDPGFGITGAGWGGCGQPQPPTTCQAKPCTDSDPTDCQKVAGDTCAGCTSSNEPDGKTCTLNKVTGTTGKCKGGACACPIPTNFRQTAGQANGGVLHFEYMWDSSTGNLADLSACQVGEKVDYPGSANPFKFPSPPWGASWQNPTIIWLAATNGGFHDNHSVPLPFVKPYVAASVTATQNYRYQCPCANNGNPVVISGPISIGRTVTQKADGNFKYTATKSGVTATVDPMP